MLRTPDARTNPRRGRARAVYALGLGVVVAAVVAAVVARRDVARATPGHGTMRLLFLQGRAATPLAGGWSVWPDAANGRLVLFDEQARAAGVLAGSPDGRRVLAEPLAAVAMGGDVLAVEGDGSALRFQHGTPARWIRSGADRGVIAAAARGSLIATRTVAEVELAPVRAGDPLLWVLDTAGRVTRTIDTVDVPANRFLGQLVNAGSVAAGDEGNIYFAAALRPEVRRYGPDGRLEWVATRPLARVPQPPTLEAPNGTLRPVFTVVQHAIAAGPDGRIYVLGSADGGGRPDRVFELDRNGRFVGDTGLGTGDAVFADDRGRLTIVPSARALPHTAVARRGPFAPFELPALRAAGRVRLADYAGRVVVVNFWASWCGPCRREMPQLDALARELVGRGVAVIGLNEDVDVAAARDFVAELGVGYPSARGEGRLRAEYGYRGLPYTVVLDREHRVVRALYGFGESIEPVRRIVMDELARSARREPTSESGAPADSRP